MTNPGLPSNVAQIFVAGTFRNFQGNALAQRLVLSPSLTVTINAGAEEVTLASEFSAMPDSMTGFVSIPVVATDDPDLNPTNFTYTVTEPSGRKYPLAVSQDTPVFTRAGHPLSGQRVVWLHSAVPAPGPSSGVVQIVAGPQGPPGEVSAAQLSAAVAAAKLADRPDLTVTGTSLSQILAPTQVDGTGKATAFGLIEKPLPKTGTRPPKATPAILTTFQAGHGWTSLGTAGAATDLNDTGDFVVGSQAVKLVSGGGGLYVAVQKTGLALDMTGKAFRLKFKVEDWTNFASLTLYAANDSNVTNSVNGQILNGVAFTPAQQYAKAGEWIEMVVPWGDLVNVAGTGVTRSAVDTVRLVMFDRNSVATTIHLNEIAVVPESGAWPNGAVVLTFDDSDLSAYSIARPKMDTYGFRGVLFPIIGELDAAGNLTTAQARQLQDVSGWEVGAHALTTASHSIGFDTMTPAQRSAELSAIRDWQRANGFNSDAYAYSSGKFSAAAEADVLRFYSLARTVYGRTHETVPVTRYGRVRATNPAGTALAQMKAEVDAAKNGKALVSFLFHNIATTATGPNGIATSDFNALVDYIASQGVAVVTYADVLATQGAKGISTETQAALDAKAAQVDPAPAAGTYYFTASPGAATTGQTGTGSLRVIPWQVHRPTTLARIGAEVTAVGDAGSKFRIGIYADNGSGYPGALVVDAGQIAGDSATVQELTISTTLQPGLYWVGGVTQAVTTTQPTLRTVTNWVPPIAPPVSTALPAANTLLIGVQAGSVTGALPGAFSTFLAASSSAPRIFVKTA